MTSFENELSDAQPGNIKTYEFRTPSEFADAVLHSLPGTSSIAKSYDWQRLIPKMNEFDDALGAYSLYGGNVTPYRRDIIEAVVRMLAGAGDEKGMDAVLNPMLNRVLPRAWYRPNTYYYQPDKDPQYSFDGSESNVPELLGEVLPHDRLSSRRMPLIFNNDIMTPLDGSRVGDVMQNYMMPDGTIGQKEMPMRTPLDKMGEAEREVMGITDPNRGAMIDRMVNKPHSRAVAQRDIRRNGYKMLNHRYLTNSFPAFTTNNLIESALPFLLSGYSGMEPQLKEHLMERLYPKEVRAMRQRGDMQPMMETAIDTYTRTMPETMWSGIAINEALNRLGKVGNVDVSNGIPMVLASGSGVLDTPGTMGYSSRPYSEQGNNIKAYRMPMIVSYDFGAKSPRGMSDVLAHIKGTDYHMVHPFGWNPILVHELQHAEDYLMSTMHGGSEDNYARQIVGNDLMGKYQQLATHLDNRINRGALFQNKNQDPKYGRSLIDRTQMGDLYRPLSGAYPGAENDPYIRMTEVSAFRRPMMNSFTGPFMQNFTLTSSWDDDETAEREEDYSVAPDAAMSQYYGQGSVGMLNRIEDEKKNTMMDDMTRGGADMTHWRAGL